MTSHLPSLEYPASGQWLFERLAADGRLNMAPTAHFDEPGPRELVVSRTPYLVRGELIEVLRVLHGRQRCPDAL